MRICIVFLFILFSVLTGCYQDNEETLAPCRIEAGAVHYSNIKSVFTNYGCNVCHSGAAPEGGISLEQYPSVKALVDNGRLLGAITHATGFAPMPQGSAKMSDCDINSIKAWIDDGAHEH